MYTYPHMEKTTHELRLFCLAIGLPAVFVVAGGISLLCVGWRATWTEEREMLQAQATLYLDNLLAHAGDAGLDDDPPHGRHGPPHDRHGPPPKRERPDRLPRPGNAPPHRWSDTALEKLPDLCEVLRATHKKMQRHLAFEIHDEGGEILYATPDYPDPTGLTGESPLAPPLGEGVLRVARPDGGAAVRTRAIRILAFGACLLALLVCTLLAGGALLVRGLRRERRDARRKTDFIDNVSHELKTPLAGIRLNAELLAEDRLTDDAKRKSAVKAILMESDRLARMVDELLDFSRLEKGTRRYNLETFDLAEFAAQDAVIQAMTAISHGRARITVKGAQAFITADKDALRQISTNLVTNAVKYSDGDIEIEVEGPETRFMDRGPGVPDGDEERIFERFYRVDKSLTRTTSGSGIGLCISRALARGMGGDLTYSRRPGGGSVFTLTLKGAN